MRRMGISMIGLSLLAGVSMSACTSEAFLNNTASLGGGFSTATGQLIRGALTVVFDNRTPYRAVFTYGLYDQQDRSFAFDPTQQNAREMGQFVQSLSPSLPTTTVQAELLGNTFSAPITLRCARTLDVGTQRVVEVVQMSNMTVDLDAKALQPGIYLYPANDPTAADPIARIDGVSIFQGAEFPCEALVIVTLEQAADGSFGASWQVILP